MYHKQNYFMADVRLNKISCFSDIPDYKQGDLTSTLVVDTHTHIHKYTIILQFLDVFRAGDDSYPSSLILIYPRATRSYTS